MKPVQLYKSTVYVLAVQLDDGRWLVDEVGQLRHVPNEQFAVEYEAASEADLRELSTVGHAKKRAPGLTGPPRPVADDQTKTRASAGESADPPPAKHMAKPATRSHPRGGAPKYDWERARTLWVMADPSTESVTETRRRIAQELGITVRKPWNQVANRERIHGWPARGSGRTAVKPAASLRPITPVRTKPPAKPPRIRSDNVTQCPDCKVKTDSWPCDRCGSTSQQLRQRISSMNGQQIARSDVGA